MFEFLPYGASAKVVCIKSSKKGELISGYNSSTDYITSYQQIGLGGSYFLLSDKEPVEMEYSYFKENGILVEIITNFEVIADNINIRDTGNGHYSIINREWLESGNGKFKISNENWFNNKRQEEPYIKLCFNEVQIECCFTNPWEDIGRWVAYCSNGWEKLDEGAMGKFLKPYSNDAHNYCILARYIIVSWNKEENNQLYYAQYINDEHWYQIWFSYMDENGDIINFDGTIREQNTIIPINDFLEQRLWSHTQAGDNTATCTVTIPPLNGTGEIKGGISNKSIIPYNYFKIGYTINFGGEGTYQPGSTLFVRQTNHIYSNEGFIYENEINSTIISEKSSPILYSHPSKDNWTNNSKFYKTEDGKYVSPSDGLEIISAWEQVGNIDF